MKRDELRKICVEIQLDLRSDFTARQLAEVVADLLDELDRAEADLAASVRRVDEAAEHMKALADERDRLVVDLAVLRLVTEGDGDAGRL